MFASLEPVAEFACLLTESLITWYKISDFDTEELKRKFKPAPFESDLLSNNLITYIVTIKGKDGNFEIHLSQQKTDAFDLNITNFILDQTKKNTDPTQTSSAINKARQDKAQDLENLNAISASIDAILMLLPDGNTEILFELFKKISQLSKSISFNDTGEYSHQYIRNKYGTINRAQQAKRRPNGLELTCLAVLDSIECTGKDSAILKEISTPLLNDFKLIKSKIELIITREKEGNNASKLPDSFKEASTLISLTSYCHSRKLITNLVTDTNDKNLVTLDFKNREHRYYFGRVLTKLGETSKELIDYINYEKESGLFTAFKKFRDQIGHGYFAMISDSQQPVLDRINQKWLPQFALIINILMQDEIIVDDNTDNHWDKKKNHKMNLGTISTSDKDELKQLAKGICKSTTADPLPTKTSAPSVQKSVTVTKPEPKVRRGVSTMSIAESLAEIEKMATVYKNTKNKKIVTLKEGLLQFAKLKALKTAMFKFITEYNKKAIETNLAEQVLPLDTSTVLKAIEDIQSKQNPLPRVTPFKVLQKKSLVQEKQNIEYPMQDNKNIRLSALSHELSYADNLRQSPMSPTKEYALQFSISKIGQLIRDLLGRDKNLITELAPPRLNESMAKTTQCRHKIMHSTSQDNSFDTQQVMVRDVLPIKFEIEAIQILDMIRNNENSIMDLLNVANSYTILGNYDKANDCYKEILSNIKNTQTLCKPEILFYFNLYLYIGNLFRLRAYDAVQEKNETLTILLYEERIKILNTLLILLDNNKIKKQVHNIFFVTLHNIATIQMDLKQYKEAHDTYETLITRIKTEKTHGRAVVIRAGLAKGRIFLELAKSSHKDTDNTILLTQFQMKARRSVAYLLEAQEQYQDKANSRDSKTYIRILFSLIDALVINADPESLLTALFYYPVLKTIIENTPLRKDQPEFEFLAELDVKIIYVLQALEAKNIVPDDAAKQKAVASLQLEKLYYVASFYESIEWDAQIATRIKQAQHNLLVYENQDKLNQIKAVAIANDLYCQSLDACANDQLTVALKSGHQALAVLNASSEMYKIIILCSLGDIYICSGNPTKGLECFEKAFSLALSKQRHDCAFVLLDKITPLYQDQGKVKAIYSRFMKKFVHTLSADQLKNIIININHIKIPPAGNLAFFNRGSSEQIEAIKDIFTCLTNHSGWKSNSQNGLKLWTEVSNVEKALLIKQKLDETGMTTAKIQYRAHDGLPIIICDNINMHYKEPTAQSLTQPNAIISRPG